MANVASGLDTAWQFPSVAGLRAWKAAAGPTPVVSLYLSYDPSKNATPARIRTLHSLGIGVELNFEYTATRALDGHAAGVADGQQAAHLIRALEAALGYRPATRLIVPFSVDFDASPGQFPAIDAYLRGGQAGLGGVADEGDYGSYAVVMHTAKAGISHMEWQTYAWSGGRFAAGVSDFYQWRNSQKVGGADVDYDQVIDAAKLGAWWPPGHPLNRPRPLPTPKPAPKPVPARPPLPAPDPSTVKETTMMIVVGDPAEYKAAKQGWRGFYLCTETIFSHIVKQSDLDAFRHMGLPTVHVSRATFEAMLAASK